MVDERKAQRKRHPLPQVLIMTLLAKLAGEQELAEIAEWFVLSVTTVLLADGGKQR